jgi:TonB family protein
MRAAPHTARPFFRLLRVCLIVGATSMLAACGDADTREVKGLKEQVQRAYGEKEFAKVLGLAQKGLTLSVKTSGTKAPDTLYFAQAISEANLLMRNGRGAILALRQELDLRAAAGQSEQKLQPRRALLIKLAEEAGDKTTAIDQALKISKAIEMGPGKEPQPVYQMAAYYPVQPYQQKIEGAVEIQFGLDGTGGIVGARVARSQPPGVFDNAALEAFRKWRYTPMLDSAGQPVSASGFTYRMDFRLKN